MYIYVYVYVCMYVYIYIYIYRQASKLPMLTLTADDTATREARQHVKRAVRSVLISSIHKKTPKEMRVSNPISKYI